MATSNKAATKKTSSKKSAVKRRATKATSKKARASRRRREQPTAAGHWTERPSASAAQAGQGLKVVPSLMSWVKDGVGKPNADERNLFMASVAFAYGVWENYVEQLALELVGHLSDELDPARVPDDARRDFTKNRDAWEVAVSPGWKELWRTRIRELAIGDEGDKFGLNTANAGQVKNLFRLVGIDPFDGIDPDKIAKIAEFVRLRGQIVHTARVPEELRKADPIAWGEFVETLVQDVDEACRRQCASLLGR